MTRQLRLELRRPSLHSRADYVVGPSNRAAVAMLDAWPGWHGQALALFGPCGAGKSHLASAWADASGATRLDRSSPDLSAAERGPVLIEDVDQGMDDEALFHLINMAGRDGGGLLLTARLAPAAWPTALPDLRSRLNALAVAEIEAPDDDVLKGVLRRFFRERSIRPPDEVYAYLLRRIERSTPAAREIVKRLDEAADDAGRPISRAIARQILEDEDENLDLFDG